MSAFSLVLAGFLVTFSVEEDFFVASLSGCRFIKTIFAWSESQTRSRRKSWPKMYKMALFLIKWSERKTKRGLLIEMRLPN